MEIGLDIEYTQSDKREKLQKAIKVLSKKMGIPVTIEQKKGHKEEFPFYAQDELYADYLIRFGSAMDDLYSRICSTLGMIPSTVFKKSIDPNAPKLLRNEILWNPETGLPISQKDIDALLKATDKFLNRNVRPMQKEFVINQAAVSRMLSNLRKDTEMEKLRDIGLDDLVYKTKKWDFYDSYAKINNSFPDSYERLKFRERVVGNYITDIEDSARKKIRDTIDNGVLSGRSKAEISSDLFDKFGSLNKDWDRIVNTEGSNIFNAEFIQEQKREADPDEPLYFIRREYLDAKTCDFCEKAADPVIARWVDTPMQNDEIDDPVASIALWSGKSNMGKKKADWLWTEGPIHSNCRGMWDRYYPEYGDIEL